ncbi:MAG: DMT family transporter [Phycisphaerae bacterium]
MKAGSTKALGVSLALTAVTAIWGWSFFLIWDAIQKYDFVAFLGVRFIIAAAAMAPFVLRRATWPTFATGLAIGLMLAAAYLFQTWGQLSTNVSDCALITGLFIVLVPVCDWLVFRRRPARQLWLALGISVVGTFMLAWHGPRTFEGGDALVAIGALAFAMHISLLSRYSRRHDSGVLTMAQMLAVGLTFCIAWPFRAPLTLPPAGVWPAILITAVLGAALGFYVQTAAQRKLPATRAAIILATEPVFGATFGYVLAGDRLDAPQIVGGVLILAAVGITEALSAARRGADANR